jgi:hypothetical protein
MSVAALGAEEDHDYLIACNDYLAQVIAKKERW